MTGPDIPLGRILGIRVRANWTVLLLVPFALWALGAGVFPEAYPELSGPVHLAMAAAATLLLLVAILLHELGHAVAARRMGVPVESVTLWFLGGLTRFCGAIGRARTEVRVTAAGPAVTGALAVVCGTVAVALRDVPAVAGVAAWLAYINALLLVLNLLPAFPLDGGRILRGVLWGRSGDHARATRATARTGRAIGTGILALGLLAMMAGAPADGVWLVLLAWFLIGAAHAEEDVADAEAAVSGLTVSALMRPAGPGGVALPGGPVLEVHPDDRLDAVLEALTAPPQTALVTDGGRPVGLLLLEDVERRVHPRPPRRPPPARRRAGGRGPRRAAPPDARA